MTIEEIQLLIINFDMAVEDCLYAHQSGDKTEYDQARNSKKVAFNDLLEAIKQYKEQK
jgi:hypothetical protein